MAKPSIELEELQNLGKARPDDLIVWSNEQALLKKMAWVKASRAAVKLEDDGHMPSSGLADWVIGIADQGIGTVESAVGAPVPKEAGNIFSRMKSYLANNFGKGVVNITEGRKKRKYGIMFSGMAVGAIAGALIGTLLLPGIGTAAGGALGASIAAASPVVLGVITGVIGSAIGTFFSKKIAKKVAKGEDTYRLYQEPTRQLQQLTGLDEIELTRLNAFVKNREGQIPEGTPLHKALKELRKKAFREGSKSALEQLTYFLAQEHAHLTANTIIENAADLALIQASLEKLEKAPNLSKEVRDHISSQLQSSPDSEEPAPKPCAATEPELAPEEPDTIPRVAVPAVIKDDGVKQAAELLLKNELQQARSIPALISAFERFRQHGVSLDDVRDKSMDPESIIRRLQKCDAECEAGNNSPKLGKIPYVHDKYGLQAKVEQLIRDRLSDDANVTVLPTRPRSKT